ncbi:response regulator transcription factor [Microvirga subterranea]|uniref:LuxR family two component transcriptional regulator n=1 Tax=Microvirga subterranea TaxID=186651 RepID=A0A370H2T0_9HYPH|nr:response regulator [Microvirga subterranea]RDI50516.1 LuxR family two component transcriptional regulator [Microvirga subterranea]
MNLPRTVFLIDDDEDVRDALRMLLRAAGFAVEAFPSALAFLERRDQKAVGCIVADVRMPGLSGLQLLERLATEGEHMPVVVITGHGDVNACRRAFKGGAVDFLTKPVDEQVLIEAIEVGLARLEAQRREASEADKARALLSRLTQRENEILDMVARGWMTKEIARAMGVSPRTVETHRANLAEKLGTTSVAEMVRLVLLARPSDAPP